MAQTRERRPPKPAKRTLARETLVAKSGDESPHLWLEAGDAVTEAWGVEEMISSYADAVAKARKTGKDYFITYRVSPDGEVVEVVEKAADKPADDPLGAAIARGKARGAAKIADILKGKGMLTAREFGPLIGASHETVNTKRKRHEVLGLEGATRGVKYPRWQVTDAGMPLPGLAQLFRILGDQPWTVYRFLRTQHAELGGRTALDTLKAGQVEAVVRVAENQVAAAFA